MRSPHPVLLAVTLSLLALGACSDLTDGYEAIPESPVELTRSGGCGDAYLWAATEDGTVVVALGVDATERSSTEPTTIAVDLPQDDVEAVVLRGDSNLTRNLCVDVIEAEAEPDETLPLRAGTGEIVLDPAGDCGDVTGRATLEDAEADDGMSFAPIAIEAENLGCYAG